MYMTPSEISSSLKKTEIMASLDLDNLSLHYVQILTVLSHQQPKPWVFFVWNVSSLFYLIWYVCSCVSRFKCKSLHFFCLPLKLLLFFLNFNLLFNPSTPSWNLTSSDKESTMLPRSSRRGLLCPLRSSLSLLWLTAIPSLIPPKTSTSALHFKCFADLITERGTEQWIWRN